MKDINDQMTALEHQYVAFEQQRNQILNLANPIIDDSTDLKAADQYIERQLLRRHVCESRTCVQKISNLLNKKKVEIQFEFQGLQKKEYIIL